MNKLIISLKSNKLILAVYQFFFQRPIYNVLKGKNNKSVLFSYSTYHFKNLNYSAHSSYQESVLIARIFDSLGYNVDVVNNNQNVRLDYSKYSMIFGEGLPTYHAVLRGYRHKVCYYATGSHPWHCSNRSLSRLVDFTKRYEYLALGSLRLQDYRWGVAASCAAKVICIGNEQTKQTFLDAGVTDIDLINPTFHCADKAYDRRLDNINKTRKTALWLGSYGLLHKGLDLAIEAFALRPDWTLHVCGYTDAEHDLIDYLSITQNIHIHGFVDVNSNLFAELCSSCLFVLLPSCSEGIATSVITAMGLGGMIPLVTRESGINAGDYGIQIEGLSSEEVCTALEKCDSLDDESLLAMGRKAYSHANMLYTTEAFEDRMKVLLSDSLEKVRNA